jgi:hypothetical protein
MNIDEILSGVRQSLSDRLSSPFWGSFLISWSIINYEVYLILFSDNSVTTTIALMDSLIFTDAWTFALNALVGPLLASLAYIYLYPYPARWFYEHTLKQQLAQNKVKQRIENTRLLSVEESLEIKFQNFTLRQNHAQEVSDLKQQIDLLERKLNEREKHFIDEFGQPTDALPEIQKDDDISDNEFSILERVAGIEGGLKTEVLKESLPLKAVDIDYAIDQLNEKEMIDTTRLGRFKTVHLTPRGRAKFVMLRDSRSPPSDKY